MDFIFGVVVGFASGWVVMKRPFWVEDILRRLREWR